jgi:hypothetical protein
MTEQEKKELEYTFKVATRILVVMIVLSSVLITFATIFLIK